MSETNQTQQIEQQSIGFDELIQIIHSVNLYDRAKTLKACIEDELEMVLGKVNEYKRGAEINIKIKIAQGDRQQLNFTGEVTSKAPKGHISQNILYQDSKDGKLYLDDPNQLKIFAVKKFPTVEETHAKGAMMD